mgnify:CR=1 FL=1
MARRCAARLGQRHWNCAINRHRASRQDTLAPLDLLTAAPETKVVDLSADFRLSDTAAYAKWYGHEHHAPELQKEAVYGLVEIHRRDIRKARLVANPGCYTSGAQLPLTPLIRMLRVSSIRSTSNGEGLTGTSTRSAMLRHPSVKSDRKPGVSIIASE